MNATLGCKFCVMSMLSEGLVLALTVLLLYWYAQSLQAVLSVYEEPVVVAVTPEFVEVRWHVRSNLDCPSRVYPQIIGPGFSEALLDYPPLVEMRERTFTRRYPLPAQAQQTPGAYVLRMEIVAQCNPFWPTRQRVDVPFEVGDDRH
jgi:hypothetical protein